MAGQFLKRLGRPVSRVFEILHRIRADVAAIRHNTWLAAYTGLLSSAAGSQGRREDPLFLGRYHGQVYSQNGEDGMIAEIFNRIGQPESPFFLEIGVGTGLENNTRLLLERGWRGVWIEGSLARATEARRVFAAFIDSGALQVVDAHATAENIEVLLDRTEVPSRVDFLSIDIDHNTSHVWRALRRSARVACIEYNASLPPSVAAEVPYDPDTVWDGSNWYGASLKTLERIGVAKRLALVGCDLLGNNAFFVAAEEATGRFREPFTAEAHYELPKFSFLTHIGHPPSTQARRWIAPPPDGG